MSDLYFDTVLNERMASIFSGPPNRTRQFLIKNGSDNSTFSVVEGSTRRVVPAQIYLTGENGQYNPTIGIPSELLPKEINMDARVEFVITDPVELENGLVVMLFEASERYNEYNPIANMTNRWCKITNFHYIPEEDRFGFDGLYADGSVCQRVFKGKRPVWVAKRDSIPSRNKSGEDQEKIAAIILEALDEQDEAITKTLTFSPKFLANRAAAKIMRVIK